MPDDLGERSEDATPKRRAESREEGKVAKSLDLAAVILLLVTTLAMASMGVWMLGQGKLLLAAILDGSIVADPIDPASARETGLYALMAMARMGLPFLLVAFGVAFIAHFAQIGWLFAPKAIAPKISKLNPLEGFKRIFGINGFVKALLDVLKVAIVIMVSIWLIGQHQDQILVLPYMGMLECLAAIASLMLDLALRILAVLLILAIFDFAYQRWKHSQDQKMTKQQVKDEMKQTEGDPEVKQRRSRMQQQLAMQRIGSAVPQADVIVTNPEHISIALQYDQDKMNAPMVVAKGADFLAMRIRQIAMQHNIPIVERKPLARALYRDVAVGQEVPPDFYTAIAEVLAYVYRLSGKQAG